MRHYPINQGDHYAVSENTHGAGVLVQIQEAGEQARVMLSAAQARHMGAMLIASADKVLALTSAVEQILPQTDQSAIPTPEERSFLVGLITMLVTPAETGTAYDGTAELVGQIERESVREEFDRLSGVMTDLRYRNQDGGIKKRSL